MYSLNVNIQLSNEINKNWEKGLSIEEIKYLSLRMTIKVNVEWLMLCVGSLIGN